MRQTYSLANHSLLPLIYKIRVNNTFTYLLHEPQTSSLLMLNPRNKQSIQEHLSKIQQITKAKLNSILLNSYNKQNHELTGYGATTVGTSSNCHKKVQDIKPFTVGQMAVCFMSMPGPSTDHSIICVTHVSQGSTKLPVIFSGSMVGVCTVGQSQNDEYFLQSLDKFKYFPNETFILPEQQVKLQDLKFAQALNPQDDFIRQKINLFHQRTEDDKLIPTTILEQKSLNPYMNLMKYRRLLEETNKMKLLGKMRQLRQHMFK